MKDAGIVMKPIGYARSPHVEPGNTPIQPCFAENSQGTIEIIPHYEEGLSDIDGFSHIFVIYYFDRARPETLKIKPYLDETERGVFSTRHPSRPNRIGISVLKLLKRKGSTLFVSGIDMLNGTPVLDIKPYVKRFDCVEPDACGWQDEVSEQKAQLLGRRNMNPKAYQER